MAGLIALREFAPNACELRRLYVRPEHRSHGLGRALVRRAIQQARQLGYHYVLLSTLPSMVHARQLWHKFGFVHIEAYDKAEDGVLYLCLDLTSGAE